MLVEPTDSDSIGEKCRGHSPRLALRVGVPTGFSLTRPDAQVGPAIVVVMIMRHTASARTIRELLKDKGLGYTACLGSHREIQGRKKKRVQIWDFAFIGVEAWAPRVSQSHSELVNVKHNSGDYGEGIEKQAVKWSII